MVLQREWCITATGECRASGLLGKTKDHLFTLRLPVSSQDRGQVKSLQKLVGGGAAGEAGTEW